MDSAYNERREQCEAAARHFGLPALRDIDSATFAKRAHELDALEPQTRPPCRFTENERTLQARDAMNAGGCRALGAL